MIVVGLWCSDGVNLMSCAVGVNVIPRRSYSFQRSWSLVRTYTFVLLLLMYAFHVPLLLWLGCQCPSFRFSVMLLAFVKLDNNVFHNFQLLLFVSVVIAIGL